MIPVAFPKKKTSISPMYLSSGMILAMRRQVCTKDALNPAGIQGARNKNDPTSLTLVNL
jgi:hypothetical protein